MSGCPRARRLAAGVAVIAAGGTSAPRALPAQSDSSATRAAAAIDTSAVRVVVRDLGPGAAGRILRAALARPHVVVRADHGRADLPRGARFDRSVIVLGGDAAVASEVRGDVIVVGGDLFLHPGAVVEGRAVAIGGGVYNSTLAVVRGERLSFRDATFEQSAVAPGEVALTYRRLGGQPATRVWLPGTLGLRIPAYDRIDGLSATFGPEIALDTGRIRLEPLVTYRSHLGAVDPALVLLATPGRRTTIAARLERTTATNDAWIREELFNSGIALGAGVDVRNYYRADRAVATVGRSWETSTTIVTPYVGGVYERAWSVARDASATSRPWSLAGRDDREEGMLRTNPAVTGGHVASALLGTLVQIEAAELTATGGLRIEQPFSSPGDARWTQLTFDGTVAFPAFRDHRFEAFAHAVTTFGDVPPSQRFAYLGGSGTIPSVLLLSQGGDQLGWLESRYTVPLDFVRVPFGGVPAFTLRHMIGGAGVSDIPEVTQNIGLRLTVALVRLDYTFDPSRSRSGEFGIGIGLR